MPLGLLHEVFARLRVGQIEAVLVHQHGLLLQPLLPRLLRHVLPDALAERAGIGRELQAIGLAAQLDALHRSSHGADYIRLRNTFEPRRQLYSAWRREGSALTSPARN